MKIDFSQIYQYTTSFFESVDLPSIVAQNKKILLIASAALGLVTVCFAIKRCFFPASKDSIPLKDKKIIDLTHDKKGDLSKTQEQKVNTEDEKKKSIENQSVPADLTKNNDKTDQPQFTNPLIPKEEKPHDEVPLKQSVLANQKDDSNKPPKDEPQKEIHHNTQLLPPIDQGLEKETLLEKIAKKEDKQPPQDLSKKEDTPSHDNEELKKISHAPYSIKVDLRDIRPEELAIVPYVGNLPVHQKVSEIFFTIPSLKNISFDVQKEIIPLDPSKSMIVIYKDPKESLLQTASKIGNVGPKTVNEADAKRKYGDEIPRMESDVVVIETKGQNKDSVMFGYFEKLLTNMVIAGTDTAKKMMTPITVPLQIVGNGLKIVYQTGSYVVNNLGLNPNYDEIEIEDLVV